MKKFLVFMLVLMLLLAGCSAEVAPTEPATDAPTEVATEGATEAPVSEVIDTEAKLAAALQTSGYVELGASLSLSSSVLMTNDGVFDGCDHTLTAPEYIEGQTDTENGIAMGGGRLKNITILGGYRCLGDTTDVPQTGAVRLENVTVDGPNYALNFGYGRFNQQLVAEESKFFGWSSYTGFNAVTFTDCTFGWDSTGSYGNLRPYVDTILIGCHFEGKTADDGSTVPFNISLRENISGITITLEDCYVGDTLITQENITELLNVELFENEIYVSNSEG